MRNPPLILIVDDDPLLLDAYRSVLAGQGYQILSALDGEQGLALAGEEQPDLVLLDLMMPGLDGIEVCRRIKANPSIPFTPVVINTASRLELEDVVAGLDAGADEYLTKPVAAGALVARVKSMLRIKAMHDTVQEQAARLEEWNRTLGQKVQAAVGELERAARLKRFLSPQVAELVISAGSEKLLESHRREVAVGFCDLRGFTAFAERAEPEEVMAVLHEYHEVMGDLIFQFEGTLERFLGDGLMVIFNDPLPCPEPAARAVRMAVAMREGAAGLAQRWQRLGHEIGFGIGIAMGYATLGRIGFKGRFDYAAIGTVPNLAARLCGEARPGQILVSQRVYAVVEASVEVEPVGELSLKGFQRPILAYNVLGLRE